MAEADPHMVPASPAVFGRTWLAGGLALACGVGLAWHTAWIGDDFYIGLRYARNLVAGEGLVFNPGEYVEGYTNLLWVLWLALGEKFKLTPESWSNFGGISCYALAIGLLFWNHLRARRLGAAGHGSLPSAACLAAAIPDWNAYATSGLETSCYTLLLLTGFLLLTAAPLNLLRCALAGLVLGLAYLARPDAVILAVLGGLFVLWKGSDRWRYAWVYAAGFALFWYPHMLWRANYYEDIFPNTYYAKSAYATYYGQGWAYLRSFFARYWLLLAGLGMPMALLLARRAKTEEGQAAGFRFAQTMLACAFVAAYSFYVVRVGGDFMYARLLIPTVPFYLVLMEHLGAWLLPGQPALHGGMLAAGIAVLVLWPSPATHQLTDGIVDERLNYRAMQPMLEAKTAALKRYLDGLPVRLGIFGSEARLACQLEVEAFIECHGLCDRMVAHGHLPERGLVGHEKLPTPNYLVAQRRVHFTFINPVGGYGLDACIPRQLMLLDKLPCRILHWDAKVMAELRRRGAVFADFPELLDAKIAALDREPLDEVRSFYARCHRFYFAFNDDIERENAFRRRLGLPQRSR